MTCRKEFDGVVPLHLIPVTIAQRIREKGGNLYRISIIRTDGHHYTIKCRCRAKIVQEPPQKNEDFPVDQAPGYSPVTVPEPVSVPSGWNPRKERFPGPRDTIPEPGPFPGSSARIPGQEILSTPPGLKPGPGSLSGEPGMARDDG